MVTVWLNIVNKDGLLAIAQIGREPFKSCALDAKARGKAIPKVRMIYYIKCSNDILKKYTTENIILNEN